MAFDEDITPVESENYIIRLCKNEEELREYQDLRYKHLILEFKPEKAINANPDATDFNIGYDKNTVQLCAFHKNHDTGKEEIIGGYILMRFKKEDDFCKVSLKYDLSNLMKYKFEICEVSRGVVHPDHRSGIVTKLLWAGIDNYVKINNLGFIIGTMSFLGLDPLKYTQAASYLYYNYRMPEELMVRPIKSHAYYHEYLAKEEVDRKTAIRQLPPLLKGLMMIGAKTGDGFYIDHDLGVVETFAIIDVKKDLNFANFGRSILL